MLNKKLATVLAVGALSLTGCSLAPTGGTSGPDAAAAGLSAETAPASTTPAATKAAASTPAAPVPTATGTKSAAKAADKPGSAPAPKPAAAQAATAAPAASVLPAATAAKPAASAPTPAPVKAPVAQQAKAVPAASVAPAAATGSGNQAATTLGWGPVIAGDEFSNTGVPDRAKWSVYNGKGHAGKGLRSRDAVTVGGGALSIKGDAAGKTGGMSAKFARQKYGKWETRMRVAHNDPQYHPVLILWPDNSADAYNGKCWEIDYAEGNNGPGRMSFFNHIACPGNGKVHTYAKKAIDTRQWHNYAVEWSPTKITGYIDGVKWYEDTTPANIANVSMHQTIQLDWFPNGGATTPSQMDVDWVRVYK
ncbi:glycoside hydrolase family 16 protein [Arthrobacter sp. NPDC093125]|uniref:glycoside hydrolase family 16 protein n=1 Tax=Arthrobacter sp. NPDC093125 TaxID=3363944 RepID=UPI0038298D40